MNAPNFRFLPLAEVIKLTGLTKTPIYDRIKLGDFPAPVALSKQCVRWRSDEIATWMESQSQNRDVGQDQRSAKARAAAVKRHSKASPDELAGQA